MYKHNLYITCLYKGGEIMTNSGEYVRGFTNYIILSILAKFNSYGYEISKINLPFLKNLFSLKEMSKSYYYSSFSKGSDLKKV